MRAAPKILIATFGSLGDLHPFIALGQALQREGFYAVVATSGAYREIVEGEGLGFAAIPPDISDATERLGMNLGEIGRRMSEDDGFLFQQLIFPHLRESYAALRAAAEGAVAIVAHAIAFSAHALAEKLELPLAVVILSPVLLYSADDPPLGAKSPFVAAPAGPLARGYNRALLWGLARIADLWAAPLRRFRRELGLPRRAPFAFFSGTAPGVQAIALHSRLLAPKAFDLSPDLLVAGHSFHDRSLPVDAGEMSALEAFLAAGAPPIAFTLGSFVVEGRLDHYRAAIAAAQEVGRRAVLLAHPDDVGRLRREAPGDVFVTAYTPHSMLFPRCCVVAHHGGVGTSGQALRAGAPQLVTPFLGDQPDNAARLVRLGLARALPGRGFTAKAMSAELRTLLEDARFALQARAVAARVAREDGAAVAARRIATLARGAG
jgi:rhamnosyltransferase subunit B